MSGDDTTDLVLYNTTAVSFSGTLEQVDADNLAYILSGKNVAVATKTVADLDLGAVTKGQKIKLDGFNLTVPTGFVAQRFHNYMILKVLITF